MTAVNSRRVLITGIDGFTGRYLAAELDAAGYQVFGLVQNPALAGNNAIVADLLDAAALTAAVAAVKPDRVVHLAAISFVGHGDVEAFYRVNLLGTLHLLQAIASAAPSVDKILLAGSANIYGNAPVEPIDESVAPAPANDYAVSKLAMEHMARIWFDRLPIVVVRPFNYTGVGQAEQFLLPKIVAHHRRRAPVLELGNLDVARDFSDVRTVVSCYRRLLECPARGDVFNVCAGQAHTLAEVLAMAAEISGHVPEVRVNPAFVRANEVRRQVGSRRRLEEAIGPISDIPLYDTLRWMIEAPA